MSPTLSAPPIGWLLPPRLYNGVRVVNRPSMANVRRLDGGVIPMVNRMMRNGIAVDVPYLHDLAAKLKRLMEEEYAEIRSVIPRDALELFIRATVADDEERETDPEAELDASVVNVNSPEQLADLLFTHMGLGREKRLKTTKGGQRISTGKKQLEMIKDEHPIVGRILKYREYAKLLNTYVEKMPRIARWHAETGTWRVHCQFLLTRAETGRLASKAPNLMNIPAKTDLGAEVRAAFIASPGKLLLSRDLSQIELRVLAHEAAEPSMIDIFRRDGDIHVETTLRAYGLDWDKWREMGTTEEGKKQQKKLRTPVKCYHPDTEVLTRSGWKRIPDLAPGEEIIQAIPAMNGAVSLEWVVPTEVFTAIHPSGQLQHLYSEGMDLRVTPDHRMLGWGSTGKPVTVLPEDMNTTPRYWANAGLLGAGPVDCVDETLLRLAVALQADGTITQWGQITWGFTKQRKIDRLRGLLDKSIIPYNQTTASNGKNPRVTLFHLRQADASQLIDLLDHKMLPWWWLDLSPELREIAIDEAAYWDSCRISRHYRYSSVPHQNIHVLQALAAITNRKTRAIFDKPNNGGAQVVSELSVRSRSTSRTGSLSITTLPFTGEVACLSVPSTWVLVRDGGVPVICGQTVNFGICIAEGQRVLTEQRGPVPIERVLSTDKVWDGAEFVAHDGLRYNGCRDVITYDGLTATPDHRVWLTSGAKVTLTEAAACGARIVTTDDRPIRRSDCYGGTAPVYDLVNAGPRRRFTVEGKLVSNCYGLSALGLQQQLAMMGVNWSEPQAQDFIDLWFSLYPGVHDYMMRIYQNARRYGLVWDMFGRIRLVPGVRSTHSYVQSAALRESGNMPIQSGSQGILKIAMAHCEDDTGPVFRDAGIYVEPLIQIHDELIWEVDEDYVEPVSEYFGEIMNSAVPLSVPLKSEAGWGRRWEK